VANKKPMSVSVDPEMKKELEATANRGGFKNTSEMIRTLIEKHLDLVVNDGEEIPIILRIPVDLKGDKERLSDWLQKKSTAILAALTR